MFVILNAIDAKLTIAGAKQQKTIVSLDDYLKIDMNRKVIVSVTLPALNSNEYLFRTFKVLITFSLCFEKGFKFHHFTP